MMLQACRQLYLSISNPRRSPLQTGTGGSPASSEKFVIKGGTSSVSDINSGNVLLGSGSGSVRSWMDGMVSARVNEIKDTNVQLTAAKDHTISQDLLSRAVHR